MRRRWPWICGCALALVLVWAMRQPWDAASAPTVPVANDAGPDAAKSSPSISTAKVAQAADASLDDDGTPTQLAVAPAAAPDPLLQTDLTPADALLWLDRCSPLAGPDPTARFEAEWQWLGDDAAALERTRYAQARAWLIDRCGPWALSAQDARTKQLKAELIRRAAHSADLEDQLRALELAPTEPGPADVIAARRQLEAALADGRPELLRDIGRVLDRSRYGSPERLGPYAGGGASTLFALLACDLGAPCGPDSEAVRINCALRGRCGYPDFETMAFDAWHGARAADLIRQHRALLLQRIRAGQIQGLFDPIPLPPKP